MKRVLYVIFVLSAVCVFSSAGFAAGIQETRYLQFVKSIDPIAAKIASSNKPVMQETERNEYYNVPDSALDTPYDTSDIEYFYGRMWKTKSTTAAYYYETAWKGAGLTYFETTDSSLRFAGNIRIGSPRSALEKFFSYKSRDYGENVYFIDYGGSSLTFELKNNKVTKIFFASFFITPEKIVNAVKPGLDKVFTENVSGNEADIRTDEDMDEDFASATVSYVRDMNLPKSITDSGTFALIKALGSTRLKAKSGDAWLYSLPDTRASRIKKLNYGQSLRGIMYFTSYSGGVWCYVETYHGPEGWVLNEKIDWVDWEEDGYEFDRDND